MLCDRLRSPQLAQQVYQTLQPLYVSSMATHADLVQKSLLVYHSCFGDIDQAIDHAQRVIRIAADAREDFAADLYRKAAIGFWRGGESSEAIKAFEKAFESAANCGSARLQVIVALILASNSFDLGMREMSAKWLRTAEACSEKLGLAEIENIYGYGIIDICVGLRDTKRLLKIYDIIAPTESGGSGNRERWYHALGLYLRQTRGEPIDIDLETRRLAQIQSPGFELGESGDFETSVVAIVLHEQNRTADARSLIADYFNVYRRPRTPISATLRAAIEIVGSEEIPDWVARSQ
jgi:tetratricopeptide (TPR) repeat protein